MKSISCSTKISIKNKLHLRRGFGKHCQIFFDFGFECKWDPSKGGRQTRFDAVAEIELTQVVICIDSKTTVCQVRVDFSCANKVVFVNKSLKAVDCKKGEIEL